MNTVYRAIQLQQIEWQDTKFNTTRYYDRTELQKSIAAIGLINPPLLQQKSSNRYRIACGWQRMLVLKEMDKKETTAAVVNESIPDIQFFTAALIENLSIRELNLIERAVAITKLLNEFQVSTDEVISRYFPLLRLGENPKWIQWAQQLTAFPEEIQRHFATGGISFDLIEPLSQLAESEQMALMKLIDELKLGKNKQKLLRDLLHDLQQIFTISITELISRKSIQNILHDKKLTSSQKATKFFTFLYEQRYPIYSQVEKEYNKHVRSLQLPPTMQLQHSPYFESDWFSVSFRFRNAEEFANAVEYLKMISNQQKIKKLEQVINLDR